MNNHNQQKQGVISSITVNTTVMIIGFSLLISSLNLQAGESPLLVISAEPAARMISAPRQAAIVVRFNKAIKPESIVKRQSFWAFARWSGSVDGNFSFLDDNKTVVLTTDRPFSAGETVMVILSHDIQAADGSHLRAGGYSWQFWVKAKPATLEFTRIASLTTNISASSRPYGAVGSDLNHDGWLDLAVINEDTADLRIYMNRADNTGLLNAFEQPTTALGNRASPSEPSDFNGDGHVDICVANINDNTISVLLGNGDGSFAPQQLINVGNAPRGIAVLDFDGDGDIDIVNTNFESNNLSLLENDGLGHFKLLATIDSGDDGEWALAAADMDEDGLLDVVVGSQNSRSIKTLKNRGDGSFQAYPSRSAQGNVWMLVIGDVNNDGHEDVATVNSIDDNGSILKGDGKGTFMAANLVALDPFPLASDLGDLDGDGDLDWVTSSFSGDWLLLSNNAAGQFSFNQRFQAPIAASCAVLFDVDNDLDLDLALIDEQRDTVFIMSNQGVNTKSFQINPGLNGAWFNPETPGQGLLIEVFANIPLLFAAWFTYENQHIADNPPATIGNNEHRWLTAQGGYFADTANLAINLTTGGLFDNNAAVINTAAGELKITFQDCSHGLVEYQLSNSGISGQFPISRLASDNIPYCLELNKK
jgi:hypothetical protein